MNYDVGKFFENYVEHGIKVAWEVDKAITRKRGIAGPTAAISAFAIGGGIAGYVASTLIESGLDYEAFKRCLAVDIVDVCAIVGGAAAGAGILAEVLDEPSESVETLSLFDIVREK